MVLLKPPSSGAASSRACPGRARATISASSGTPSMLPDGLLLLPAAFNCAAGGHGLMQAAAGAFAGLGVVELRLTGLAGHHRFHQAGEQVMREVEHLGGGADRDFVLRVSG